MRVERVIAPAPRHCALIGVRGAIGLAVDADIHNVVAADGAGVDHNVPRPERDRTPLLHFKPVLGRPGLLGGGLHGGRC